MTIAGGGLAGLSLGIALRGRGVPVTLHEAGIYPRHRVCGEFISGVGRDTLDRLGIADILDEARPLESAEWHDASGRLGRMVVRAVGLSRWQLDGCLQARFVELGGELVTHSRVGRGEGVVWAAGRPRCHKGRWIGLKAHALGMELRADLEMHLASNGYLGIARIEGNRVNVCGLFDQGCKGTGRGVGLLIATVRAGGLHRLAERFEAAQWDADSFCGVAGFEPGGRAGEDFEIGDAAQRIPPFTGNGMSMAFESAECALEPLEAWSAGRMDWAEAGRQAARSQRRRFRRRMAAGLGMHAFLTTGWGTRVARAAGRAGVLPYEHLLSLVR